MRCFYQTFDANESFGFSGEEPDCDAEDISPASTITSVPLNTVTGFVSNTRGCEVTEVGFAAALNANSSNKSETAPPGSLWISGSVVYRIVSVGTYMASSYAYTYRSDVNNRSVLDAAFATAQSRWDNGTRYLQRLDPATLTPLPNRSAFGSADFLSKIGVNYQPYTGANRNLNTTPATWT